MIENRFGGFDKKIWGCSYKDIPSSEKDSELEWLKENIYNPGRRSINSVSLSMIDPIDRYSARI